MKMSCGLLIFGKNEEGAVLLVCHVTNSNPSRWDIPKGVQETGEEPMDCVMREVEEETGLVITEEAVLDLGIFDYLPNKQLHLFLYDAITLPSVSVMSCSSMFEMWGKEYPEVDRYKYVKFDELKNYTSPKLFPALEKALSRYHYC